MGRSAHTTIQAPPFAAAVPVPAPNIHVPIAMPIADVGANVSDPTAVLEVASPPLPPLPEHSLVEPTLLGSLHGLPGIAQTPEAE